VDAANAQRSNRRLPSIYFVAECIIFFVVHMVHTNYSVLRVPELPCTPRSLLLHASVSVARPTFGTNPDYAFLGNDR
jgi:hypothetical protein